MVICYIAQSLDGFIATPDGGLDWLPQPQVSVNGAPVEDYGYQAFLDSVDGILMGRKTFDQVLTFGPWPYAGKQVRVFTHKAPSKPALPENAEWAGPDPLETLQELYGKGCKRLWLVGGAELIGAFRRELLVDEYIITTVPVVLGAGIPLFLDVERREVLCCTSAKKYSDGLVQTKYQSAKVR